MARSKLLIFALPILLSMLAGCAQPPIYLPSSPPIPLLEKQGELRVAGSTNGSGNSGFYALEAAYAATDKIGIITNVSYGPGLDSVIMRYQEVGLGCYIDPDSSLGHFEAYGGIGYGHAHSTWTHNTLVFTPLLLPVPVPLYSCTQDASYLRPFVQGNLGFEGSVAALGFALRASYLVMHLVTDSLSDPRENVSNSSELFLEPAIVFRIGYKAIKLETKLWWSIPTSDGPGFQWGASNASLGLSIDLKP